MQGSKKIKTTGSTRKPPITNRVKVDVKEPIPFGNDLVFSFANQTTYLPFLPPKDDFARDLLEARMLSISNNACITTKKDYCAGEGIQDTSGAEIDKAILEWFKIMNLRGEGFTEINADIFEDFFTYGNCPIEVARFSVAGVKKLFVYPHSFQEWRLCRPNEDDIVTQAIQSKLFLKKGYILDKDTFKKSRKLPLYNPLLPDKKNWFRDEKGVERTLIWFKNRVTGFSHYGLPSNVASFVTQVLEYKADRFDLDNFENNMVLSAILALKGNLSQTEADRIGKKIISTHTGDGRNGRVAVVSSQEGIDASQFHQMETKRDGSYTESIDKWTQRIILANEWDAILAGIISPSTLGKGASFLTKIFELKLKAVIRPAQRKLMEKVWGHIFKIAEEWLSLPFSKYELEIKNFIAGNRRCNINIG